MMITGDGLIGRTAVLAVLYAVIICAAPTVTQAQFAGGKIIGAARGDSGSPMPGVQAEAVNSNEALRGPVDYLSSVPPLDVAVCRASMTNLEIRLSGGNENSRRAR
jgi:hypothetical protein